MTSFNLPNRRFPGNGRKWQLMLALLIVCLRVDATDIEIRYQLEGSEKVYLVWGVNDWQHFDNPPPGTQYRGKVMYTVMQQQAGVFSTTLHTKPGNVIQYAFVATRPAGPFRVEAEYWDLNKLGDHKFFTVGTDTSCIIEKKGAVNFNYPGGSFSLSGYSYSLLGFFVFVALIVFIIKKRRKDPGAAAFSRGGFFVSVLISLTMGHLFARLHIAGLAFPMVLKPFATFSKILSTSWTDLFFAALVAVFFGLLLLIRKTRRLVSSLLVAIAFLSVIFALVNIKVTELIGWPLNYQWLYYSDFLNSQDASKAIGENVSGEFIMACTALLLAAVIAGWLAYHAYRRWPVAVTAVFPLLLISSSVFHFIKPVNSSKAFNPVFFFVASVSKGNADAAAQTASAKESEFNHKNIDRLPPAYDSLFRTHPIKNVVILVLESTPAEYINGYGSSFNATPFIGSIQNQAVVFDNIYAHIPATNKSMFSILCGSYPNLSFKSISKESPDVQVPSITSELEKDQYRTLFLNSGDNDFQNAGGFLKHRGFDDVLDFTTNNCGQVFTDGRFSQDKLDGVDDSCLSVRFFDWQQQEAARPFFAMLWTFQTHYPYFANADSVQYNTNNPSFNKYLNGLHRADETLRQLVEGLKKKGLFESTLIVVTGDHGEAFGRHDQITHAANIFEENIHVPLLLINPVLFKGERISTNGGISDIAPTIFSILNKPAPPVWQGENLFSINRRKTVYFCAPYSQLLFGLREDNLKLIFNATENNFKLYDLSTDKNETKDIAKEKQAYVKEANKKLQAWMKYQYGFMDSLLKTASAK